MVISALRCDDLKDDGSYLRQDYRVDCSSSEYIPVQVLGGIFVFVWPLGAVLLLLGLLLYYKVPEMARRKIQKAELRAFIRHCMANARRHSTVLDDCITEDCILEDLPVSALRTLVSASNSVETGYKPVLKPIDMLFFKILTRFARTTDITPVPIEDRCHGLLADILFLWAFDFSGFVQCSKANDVRQISARTARLAETHPFSPQAG